MIPVFTHQKIFVCHHKVDFRKSYDGLLSECYDLGLNPFNGDVVLFIGRNKQSLKSIYADSNGLWVSSKRFNKGAMKTKFRFLMDPSASTISMAEFSMLVEGNAYKVINKKY